MTLGVIVSIIVLWVIYGGIKLYRGTNWSEPAEPTPDFKAMQKRLAELQHVQELLEEAHAQGKLSAAFMDEFNRFCETENRSVRAAQEAWKHSR